MPGIFNTVKPALLWVDGDTFQCAQVLRYHAMNGDMFEIPLLRRGKLTLSMLTDGGSKPLWSNAIVGDRCDELMNDYLHHDGLFVMKRAWRDGVPFDIDFDYTQLALDEMMRVSGASHAKRETILAAVAIGGRDLFNSRLPCDLDAITPDNLTEDWAVLPVRVTPDFDVTNEGEMP